MQLRDRVSFSLFKGERGRFFWAREEESYKGEKPD